jgi:hypothetical protein
MEIGADVKKLKDEYGNDRMLRTPTINKEERRMGQGSQIYPLMFILALSNIGIYAHRYNLANKKYSFLFALALTFPIASLVSKHMFGIKKFREIALLDEDTVKSARYYEKNRI